MPKPLTTNQALRAYSRQQTAALGSRRRAKQWREGPTRELPVSAMVEQLVAAATNWLETRAPDAEIEQREREALAVVVDFLSVHPREESSAHEYLKRFLRFLTGDATLSRRTET